MRKGIVEVTPELLLSMFQLVPGEILSIEYNPMNPTIKLLIAHHEMPECEEGREPQEVYISYTQHHDGMGNAVTIRNPIEGDYGNSSKGI